jgi:hypothetical protein
MKRYPLQDVVTVICFVAAILLWLSVLTGCAELAPDYVKPEVEHISHFTQHFGPNQAADGYNQVAVFVGYNREVSGGNGARAFFEIGEGYTVEMVDNRHEIFNARAGFEVPLK